MTNKNTLKIHLTAVDHTKIYIMNIAFILSSEILLTTIPSPIFII